MPKYIPEKKFKQILDDIEFNFSSRLIAFGAQGFYADQAKELWSIPTYSDQLLVAECRRNIQLSEKAIKKGDAQARSMLRMYEKESYNTKRPVKPEKVRSLFEPPPDGRRKKRKFK